MSTSSSNSSSSSSSATPSLRGASASTGGDEPSIWMTLGGLALGAGLFLVGQGVKQLYLRQKEEEGKWVKTLAGEYGGKERCIYLDYNGTTPIYADVLSAMLPYLSNHFGNPSSSHVYGKEPRKAIDQARARILTYLLKVTHNQSLDSIWFTGCGTESDNLAIQLALQSTSHKNGMPHIVTSNVEHPAIEGYLKYLEGEGRIEVTYVPVQPNGIVLAQDVLAAIRPRTILVTVMYANNESGALQPIQVIARECRARGILMHTDAAQAAGKVSCALADLGDPDMISLVGHKLGAPKGIAALYVRPGCLKEAGRKMPHSHGVMLIGGGQEFGRRGGTENTPYIVGFGYACQKASSNLLQNAQHMEKLRGRLLQRLEEHLGGPEVCQPNGPENPAHRLPNTLSVGLKHVHSGVLLGEIGHLVAASAGATCHSANAVSSVLQAMHVPIEYARGTLRLSLGPSTTPTEVDRAAKIIAYAAQKQWEATRQATAGTPPEAQPQS